MSSKRGSLWRPVLAVLLLLAIPLLTFILIRRDAAPQEPQPASEVTEKPIAPASPPAAPQMVGRAELVAAAVRAASIFGSTEPSPPENIKLAGQRFTLSLPFGCSGPTPTEAELPRNGWSYDAKTETLRGQVSPEVWTDAPWAAAASAEEPFEEAEGFWIARPWSNLEGCPPAYEKAGASLPSPQTVAIARFLNPGSKRSAKRSGEAYRFSKKVAPDKVPGAAGLRLVIEGRLSADPSKQPLGCWSDSPDVRPICVFNARFDRVAIVDGASKTVFAEWND